MHSPLRLLVDSNVWVDSYLGDHAHFDESFRFLKEARGQGAELLYGASKLEGMFCVLTAEFERGMREGDGDLAANATQIAQAFAWGCIDNIRELGTAVGMDESDLWLACKYRAVGRDLQGNVLLAAAQRADADYVVTWDEELLASPVVRAATPTQMIALLGTTV